MPGVLPLILMSLIACPLVDLLRAQEIAPLPAHPSPKGQDSRDHDARPAKCQQFGTAGLDNTVGVESKPDISNLSDGDGNEDELSVLKVCLCHLFAWIPCLEAHTPTTSLL